MWWRLWEVITYVAVGAIVVAMVKYFSLFSGLDILREPTVFLVAFGVTGIVLGAIKFYREERNY